MNVEFSWNSGNISEEAPAEWLAIKAAPEMVSKATSKTKPGKAAGPSVIVIEMIKAAGDGVTVWHHSSTI